MISQSVLPLDADDNTPAHMQADSASAENLTRPGPAADSRDFALHLLALGQVRGVGVKTLRALIEHYRDLSRVWDDDPQELAVVLERAKVPRYSTIVASIREEQDRLLAAARRELRTFQATHIRLLGAHEPEFPSRLTQIPNSPYWIFVEGNIEALHTLLIGIVGTRTPSDVGIQAAERLAALVAREGLGIISGLAEGIDASAHRVGLYYRTPQVAVLGTGIDVVFPTSTEQIRHWLLQSGGAVITEYLPGDSYNRANFVERNRIQAALAHILAPVESRLQSGTAHTVRFAEQYGRPIFGVQRGDPSPINELMALLVAKGYPIFDLAVAETRSDLLAWIQSVISSNAWPQERRSMDARWFFRDILRQIDDLMIDVPLPPQDAQWLYEELAKRIQYPLPQDEERRNGRGH